MFKSLSPSALGVSGQQSEIIELALTYGFRGIEINMEEFATRVRLHGMKYARRLIDSALNQGKVKIAGFFLPFDWEGDDDAFKAGMAKMPEYTQVAKDLGCTRCLCTISPASETRPYHENFETHRRRFTEICQLLEPAGMRLGVGFRAAESLRKGQPYQFIHDIDALSLLLTMVGAPNLGMLIDVWDLYVSGASVENVRGLQPHQVVAVQLADAPADVRPAELTEQQRLLPGTTGQIDSAAYLVALAEMGYDGPVAAKPDRKAFDSSRRDRMGKQLIGSLDKVWQAAGLASEGNPSVPAGN